MYGLKYKFQERPCSRSGLLEPAVRSRREICHRAACHQMVHADQISFQSPEQKFRTIFALFIA